jgi:hypothetical protein
VQLFWEYRRNGGNRPTAAQKKKKRRGSGLDLPRGNEYNKEQKFTVWGEIK